MTHAKDQVATLVDEGKITPDEAASLMAALAPAGEATWKRVLFNPFATVGTPWLLGAGLASVAVSVLARSDIRFDGALDLHLYATATSLRTALFDQLIAWPMVALVLWVVSLAARRRGRLVDFLGVVGLARVPLTLSDVRWLPLER